MRIPVRFLAAVLFLTALLPAFAEDWARFRGPNGAGTTTSQTPTEFTAKEITWKTEIPGIGHSSPIVYGKQIFLQTAAKDGSTRSMVCLNAETGKLEWSKNVSGVVAKTHKKNSLASSTPVCDGEKVYGTFWDGKALSLVAFDLKGNEKWTTLISAFDGNHGPGHSPIVVDGLVFVNFDDDTSAKVIAYDAKTGKEKWHAERKKYRTSYSSPIVREFNGKKELVVATTTSIDGYDIQQGTTNWSYPITWETGSMPLRAVSGPTLSVKGEYITMATGDGGGGRYVVTIKVEEKGATKVWDMKKDSPYVPAPLVFEDHMYWLTDAGLAVCVDVKTGKIVWSERVLQRGAISSSPILVKDTILVIAEDGTVINFKATSKGLERGKDSKVGETVFATPAATNGKLYIRGESHLFCIAGKGS